MPAAGRLPLRTFKKVSVNDNVHFLNLTSSGYDIIID
jgi:hypothetical protein